MAVFLYLKIEIFFSDYVFLTALFLPEWYELNMRRSAAPSQVLGNVAKKPRFIPPGKSNALCPKIETEETDQDVKLKEVK